MCLVLIIRICLLPLFFSQMRATQRMQVLQPQIQRIQRRSPRVRIRVPKKPCNVKLWLCSSGITPIRSVHTCFADSGADSVLAVLHAAIPARKRRRECGTVERHRPRHGGRHRIIVHIRRAHRRLVRHGRLAAVARRHRRGRGVDVSDVVRDAVAAHPSQYAEGRHGFTAVPHAEADRVCVPGHLRGVGRHLAVRRAAVLADQ